MSQISFDKQMQSARYQQQQQQSQPSKAKPKQTRSYRRHKLGTINLTDQDIIEAMDTVRYFSLLSTEIEQHETYLPY